MNSRTISSDLPTQPQAVSAEEFAERLFDELDRKSMLRFSARYDSAKRADFILTATAVIYDAMIETCGSGIKQ